MRVYKAKRNITFTGPVYHVIREGELLYQEKDSYLAASGFYPIYKTLVEDRTDYYERLPDDDHDAAYYLEKKYTQHQMDQNKK
jgi:hypothetical protein